VGGGGGSEGRQEEANPGYRQGQRSKVEEKRASINPLQGARALGRINAASGQPGEAKKEA
jgi:hypothetical protein